MFPNPVNDVFNISSQFEIDQISIYNLQGKIVKQGDFSNMNVSDMASGVYFVEIFSEGKQSIQKIIKQ